MEKSDWKTSAFNILHEIDQQIDQHRQQRQIFGENVAGVHQVHTFILGLLINLTANMETNTTKQHVLNGTRCICMISNGGTDIDGMKHAEILVLNTVSRDTQLAYGSIEILDKFTRSNQFLLPDTYTTAFVEDLLGKNQAIDTTVQRKIFSSPHDSNKPHDVCYINDKKTTIIEETPSARLGHSYNSFAKFLRLKRAGGNGLQCKSIFSRMSPEKRKTLESKFKELGARIKQQLKSTFHSAYVQLKTKILDPTCQQLMRGLTSIKARFVALRQLSQSEKNHRYYPLINDFQGQIDGLVDETKNYGQPAQELYDKVTNYRPDAEAVSDHQSAQQSLEIQRKLANFDREYTKHQETDFDLKFRKITKLFAAIEMLVLGLPLENEAMKNYQAIKLILTTHDTKMQQMHEKVMQFKKQHLKNFLSNVGRSFSELATQAGRYGFVGSAVLASSPFAVKSVAVFSRVTGWCRKGISTEKFPPAPRWLGKVGMATSAIMYLQMGIHMVGAILNGDLAAVAAPIQFLVFTLVMDRFSRLILGNVPRWFALSRVRGILGGIVGSVVGRITSFFVIYEIWQHTKALDEVRRRPTSLESTYDIETLETSRTINYWALGLEVIGLMADVIAWTGCFGLAASSATAAAIANVAWPVAVIIGVVSVCVSIGANIYQANRGVEKINMRIKLNTAEWASEFWHHFAGSTQSYFQKQLVNLMVKDHRIREMQKMFTMNGGAENIRCYVAQVDTLKYYSHMVFMFYEKLELIVLTLNYSFMQINYLPKL